MRIIADGVKVGDRIWGRTVSRAEQTNGDTRIMFTFEDGGILHVSQNRLIEDYQEQPSKDLAEAITSLKSYMQWASTGSDHRLRKHAADIRQVLAALDSSQKQASDAGWQAEYTRTMNPEQGRDGYL